MKPLLFVIQPRLSPGGARTTVRLVSGGSGAAAGVGGFAWEAAIVRRPRFSIELLSPSLDGRVQLGRGDFTLNLNAIRQVAAPRSLYWPGSPVTIYDATNLDLTTAPIEFVGFVRSGMPDLDTDQVTLNCEVSAEALEKPVLSGEFTGAGGAAGEPATRGTPKPAGFGSVKNIEPVWFDTVRNIGMIDGYANTVSINALFEGASDFGARVADYANYATLAARIDDKTVAPGRWATCVAEGLVGLGAPPVAPIGVDAVFGSNRPGALMRRLIETHAGVAVGDLDTAAYTALDASVNRPVHHWLGAAREVKELIEAIAASCNATPIVTFQGKHSVTRVFGGANALTINKQAPTRATRVTKWRSLEPDAPTWRMKMRAERPASVLTNDQVLYADDIIDRGVFNAITVYRQGNLAWNEAGAQFLYINATPGAGAALPVLPATANSSWQQTKPAPDAADLYYVDGTPLEYLKPAQPNADVTADKTALGDGNRVRYSLMEGGALGYGILDNPSGVVASVYKTTAGGYNLIQGAAAFTAGPQIFTIGTMLSDPAYRIKVTPGERISVSLRTQVDLGAGGGIWQYSAGWLNAAGAATADARPVIGSGDFAIAFGTRLAIFTTVPAGAVSMWIEGRITSSNAGARSIGIIEPMVTSAGPNQTVHPAFTPGPSNEYGADVTVITDGPSQSTEFAYTHDNIIDFTARDLTFKLIAQGANVASGVVWTYRVMSGTVNGFTGASGVKPMTGAGVGTLNVSSLGSDVAVVEVTGFYNGKPHPKLVELTKKRGDIPVASTGGGASGTIASKTSGFTSFSSTTPTSVTGDISFTLSAAATVSVSVSLEATPINASPYGSWALTGNVQRVISGTPTTQTPTLSTTASASSAGTGGAEPQPDDEPPYVTPGQVTGTVSLGSLAAGTHVIRVVLNPNAVRSHSVNGSVVVFI